MKFASRISRLKPSFTMQMAATAVHMRQKGLDVVDFTVGEPDFSTSSHICDAAKIALDEGFTKYTSVSGIPELKSAIRTKVKRDNNIEIDSGQILVSNGGKQSLYLACQALFEKGDEALIFSPYWVSYPEMVRLSDAEPVIISTDPENQYEPDFDSLENNISPKVKGVIINNPSNPTGAVWSDDAVKRVLTMAKQHEWVVFSDECYEQLVYDKSFKSVECLNQVGAEVITFMTLSKSYAMTGWRVGYAFGNEDFIKAMTKLQGQETSCANAIAQKAAVEALTGDQSSMIEMKETFRNRRDLMIGLLNEIPKISCSKPKGAFYAFPDCSGYFGTRANGKTMTTSTQLSEYILEESKVVTVPGDGFGAPKNIRFSYAVSSEMIQKGIDRLSQALDQLN
ncbi:MAG: pyridoxal phosphate-dependent aminotransferase [Candidatus Marinimicrobia bacterium]|jgi:aspartate aminotransferase|nr:pyridoxal phosphate-dependent aminotransferase [Candidatus Neomarinimicrobiota bacterium]